jgi:hypothetical protein
MQKVSPNQPALQESESLVRVERVLHLVGPRLKDRQQIAMATLEVLENIGQLTGGRVLAQGKNTIDNVVGPGFVSRIEIARLRRRLEGPNNNSRRIRSQIKRLPVQECNFRQGRLESLDPASGISGLQSNERAYFRPLAIDARQLSHFGETEQVGNNRFATAVLVQAVGMQPVATTPRLQINQ